MAKTNVPFEYEGVKYHIAVDTYHLGVGGAGLGCHAVVATGIGCAYFQGVYKTDTQEKAFSVKNNWGDWTVDTSLMKKVIGTAFPGDDDFKDTYYRELVKSYDGYYGSVVFSDAVNRGTAIKPTRGQSTIPGLKPQEFGPAVFAKWIHDHPEHGVIFSTPVYGNPNHRTVTDYSLVQIFCWIPKKNEWTIAVDIPGAIPPVPPNITFNKEKLSQEVAKVIQIPPETADKVLTVSYL